jgi:hypothetical protein
VKFRFLLPVVFAFWFSVSLIRPAHCITITSSTHPSLLTHDFSDESIPFAPFQKEGGVVSGTRFKIEKNEGADGALVITNAFAGSFGINTKTPAFDATKFGHLFFDYALSPGVKVNLFFRVKGIYHGAIFSGPPQVRPGSVLLGKIEGVTADGKWHRAHIPLRDWLRKLYPTDSQLMVDEITIGNWDNSDYLMALGVGGNGAGVSWKLDDFSIVGAGPSEASFSVLGEGNTPLAKPAEYSWSLDGGNLTALSSPQLSLSASEGFHTLQIFDKAKKVSATYGFFATESAPKIGKIELKNNVVRVPIQSEAGLDARELKLTISGRAFQLDSPYLSWDGAAGVLALEADDAGLEWKDGQQIPVAVEGVRDVLGRTASPLKTTLEVEFQKHKSTPPAPLLASLREMGSGTFEDSLDEWSARPEQGEGPAIVERDDDKPAAGKYSVRLTCPANAASFAATIRRTPFDASRYPIVEFDYRVPPELRVDFLLNWNGQTMSAGFTDKTPQWTRIGQVPGIIADSQWHHARWNLYAMMRAAQPNAGNFRINSLALADTGWLGNSKGTQYWIDNFQFVPVVKGAPFESGVLAPDVTGIKGVSWTLDGEATTEPPQTIKAESKIEVRGAGAQWLHLRAQNGAGVWSATSHLPLFLDGAPPQIGAPDPASGARLSLTTLKIPLSDDSGIDLSSLVFSAQGKEYSPLDGAAGRTASTPLRLEGGKLIFDVESALDLGKFVPLTDGARVTWSLKNVRDVAGQSVPDISGDWIHDFAGDKRGPRVQLNSSTHAASFRANFDSDFDGWVGETLRVERARRADAEASNFSLRATVANGNVPFTLRLMRSWNMAQQPMVGFAYKFPPNLNLALRLRANTIVLVKIAGETPGTVGEIPGIIADNQWHWTQFNVAPLFAKMGGITQVGMIELVDQTGKTPANASFEIDDFTLQSASPGNVKLNWKAIDISGVKNYRFAWDQSPITTPTEETSDTSREIARDTKATAGTWWAHVQAQDNAGNWGAVAHLPVMLP